MTSDPKQRIIITPAGHHLDETRMEKVSDDIIRLCVDAGLTRAEAASMFVTLAGNHLVAMDVGEERAGLSIIGFYRWRKQQGFPQGSEERILVPE